MPLIQGPDAGLWVEVAGRGSPVTVFAHGLSSSSADIAAVAGRLAGTRVLFDFRGHGRSESPPPSAGYDQAAMTRDLAFVSSAYAATHAVGVSLGAASILRLLSEDPSRFDAVCLILPAWIDGAAPDREANARLAALLADGRIDTVRAEIAESDALSALARREASWPARFAEQVRRMGTPGMPHALRSYPSGPPPVADPDALTAVTARTLVLGHEGDPAHPAAVALRLGTLIPGAEVRLAREPLEMLDDPAGLSREIDGFFGAVAPRTVAG